MSLPVTVRETPGTTGTGWQHTVIYSLVVRGVPGIPPLLYFSKPVGPPCRGVGGLPAHPRVQSPNRYLHSFPANPAFAGHCRVNSRYHRSRMAIYREILTCGEGGPRHTTPPLFFKTGRTPPAGGWGGHRPTPAFKAKTDTSTHFRQLLSLPVTVG